MAALENSEFSSLGSGSSPFKKKEQGTFADSTTIRLAKEIQKEMEEELRHQWVGPMPVEEFFKECLPISNLKGMPKVPKDYFDAMPKGKNIKESEMYDPLIDLVKKKELLPGFQTVNTSNSHDANSIFGKKIKPDISTYQDGVDISINRTQFDKQELLWELKPSSAAEPFSDPAEDASLEELKTHRFETDTDAGVLTRGQIATYLTEIASRQHRTHAFLVFMDDSDVRFLRADRTGILVSRSINYRENSRPLVEFLWRFSRLSEVGRGLDPTFRPASVGEEELAQKELSQWAPQEARPVVVLQVPDSEDKRGFREVIAWGSMSDAHSLTGRATRGWPVFDLKAKKVAFLKDSWRSLLPHLDKESSILKELTDAKVRNIPKYICGDDLGQTTQTQEFVGKGWKAGPTSESTLVKRSHHRLLTDFVGHRISKFQSSRQLMQAIYDAYLAHMDAFLICGILHRDISVGNILLSFEGNGILNDWDMARKVKDIRKGPRQPCRTGTWLFMSIRLLRQPTAFHELQDDLESFCYVVLYLALRYLPHNKVSELPNIMASIFEQHSAWTTGVLGGAGKLSLLHGRTYIGTDLEFTDNQALTSWIDVALKLVTDWYNYLNQSMTYVVPGIPIMELKNRPLRDHKILSQTFETALGAKTWPQNDKAVDHLPPRGKNSHHHKRKREGVEEESVKPKKSKSSLSRLAPSLQRSDQCSVRRSSRLGSKNNGDR